MLRRLARPLAGGAAAALAGVFTFAHQQDNFAAAETNHAEDVRQPHASAAGSFIDDPDYESDGPGAGIGQVSERLIIPPARKRIAIYGGSFNPITNAHLNVAAEIMHSKLADEVWITPCGKRPDKPSLRTSMVHRLVMCHLAVDTTFGSRFGVKVCDEEADKPRSMPSIVLMRNLAQKYPEADFIFACGADQIKEVKSWTADGEPGFWDAIDEAGEKFFDETHFLLIDRPGEDMTDVQMPANVMQVSEALKARGSRMIETMLSSTEVRNRVRPADDIVRHGLRKVEPGGARAWYDEAEGLVPPSVLGHIVRYGLYARDYD